MGTETGSWSTKRGSYMCKTIQLTGVSMLIVMIRPSRTMLRWSRDLRLVWASASLWRKLGSWAPAVCICHTRHSHGRRCVTYMSHPSLTRQAVRYIYVTPVTHHAEVAPRSSSRLGFGLTMAGVGVPGVVVVLHICHAPC
jgi:hypothetical protein